MPIIPTPGGGGNKGQWWVVVWWHASGVNSRFSQPSQPQRTIVHAATAQAALNNPAIPSDAQGKNAKGPFMTRADAEGWIKKDTQKLSNLEQSGSIDIFHGLNLGSILIRIGEFLLGIVLIGVGTARITGVENAVSSAVKNIKVVPV